MMRRIMKTAFLSLGQEGMLFWDVVLSNGDSGDVFFGLSSRNKDTYRLELPPTQ